MRRTKAEAMETRRRILEASFDIFSEKNFSDVSVSEIAEKVGMTKGAIYWHFRNKEDILVQIIEDFCERTGADFVSVHGVPQEIKDLRGYFKSALTMSATDPDFYKLQKLMLSRHEWTKSLQDRVLGIIRTASEKERSMIDGLLKKAQRDGSVRKDFDTNDVAILISAVFQGLCILQMADLLPKDFAKQADFLINAFTKELH
jgi:AcrR family transcriptional regulator